MSSAPSNENRGPALAAFNAVMIGIPTVAIILRFWSRTLCENTKRGRFWWDDWVALAALPVSASSNAATILMIHFGVGRHEESLPPRNVEFALKTLFANYILYDTALTLAKSSAVFFYFRVFEKHSKAFAAALWITQALVWAWWIGICLGTILMCNPVQKNYKPTMPGHCGNTGTLWVASAIPSVAIDAIILLLPMPMLWRLKLKLGRKIMLIITFACGYSVILISLGRLVTVLKDKDLLNEDITFFGVDSLYWLGAESPILILSICLPSFIYLYRRVKNHGATSVFTSQSTLSRDALRGTTANSHTGFDHASTKVSQNSQEHLFDAADLVPYSTNVNTIAHGGEPFHPGSVPIAAIHLRSEYDVTRVQV